MNIESAQNVKEAQNVKQKESAPKKNKDNNVTFSEELKNISTEKKEEAANTSGAKTNADEKINTQKESENNTEKVSDSKIQGVEKEDKSDSKLNVSHGEKQIQDKEFNTNIKNKNNKKDTVSQEETTSAINGLEGIVKEMNNFNNTPNSMTDEFNHENEKMSNLFKQKVIEDDKNIKNEDNILIDNNMNIQEPKEPIMPDMNTNMNFNSNGQPFSEFINSDNKKVSLKSTSKEIMEEKQILSTMEENIAIANKNIVMSKNNEEVQNDKTTKTVINQEGIKKVDKKSNIVIDTIVTYDTVIMDKSDVEFFSNIVNGDISNISEIKNPEKSAAVSKTLADLLAKAMNDNKPVRIDFDNNISVIIKISRDGKISADFLPSSQVAEAYLKENLPLLRQRFDDNNIEYEELNQREQKRNNENENRKKGRKDE